MPKQSDESCLLSIKPSASTNSENHQAEYCRKRQPPVGWKRIKVRYLRKCWYFIDILRFSKNASFIDSRSADLQTKPGIETGLFMPGMPLPNQGEASFRGIVIPHGQKTNQKIVQAKVLWKWIEEVEEVCDLNTKVERQVVRHWTPRPHENVRWIAPTTLVEFFDAMPLVNSKELGDYSSLAHHRKHPAPTRHPLTPTWRNGFKDHFNDDQVFMVELPTGLVGTEFQCSLWNPSDCVKFLGFDENIFVQTLVLNRQNHLKVSTKISEGSLTVKLPAICRDEKLR